MTRAGLVDVGGRDVAADAYAEALAGRAPAALGEPEPAGVGWGDVSRLNPDEKKTAKEVLDGLILMHQAKRWASSG